METIGREFKRVRFELQRRTVEVAHVERPTAGFVAVTFKGSDLQNFQSLGFDDHIKFIFTNASGETIKRDYTPRAFNTQNQELTIEFALHDQGDASDWARNTGPGEQAVIAGPKGSMIIPEDFDWHLLVADSSSLPAVARRLEELPLDVKTIVFIQVDHLENRRDFKRPSSTIIKWVESHEDLVDMVKEMHLPTGEGFIWAGGEHSAVLQIRTILLEKEHPKELMKVVAYWKKGAADFHEKI